MAKAARQIRTAHPAPEMLAPPKPVISRVDLLAIKTMQDQRRVYQKEVDGLETRLKVAEGAVITLLETGGATLAPDAPMVAIDNKPRRNIKWKEHFVAANGVAAAMQVEQATPQTDYKHLVINGEVPSATAPTPNLQFFHPGK